MKWDRVLRPKRERGRETHRQIEWDAEQRQRASRIIVCMYFNVCIMSECCVWFSAYMLYCLWKCMFVQFAKTVEMWWKFHSKHLCINSFCVSCQRRRRMDSMYREKLRRATETKRSKELNIATVVGKQNVFIFTLIHIVNNRICIFRVFYLMMGIMRNVCVMACRNVFFR